MSTKATGGKNDSSSKQNINTPQNTGKNPTGRPEDPMARNPESRDDMNQSATRENPTAGFNDPNRRKEQGDHDPSRPTQENQFGRNQENIQGNWQDDKIGRNDRKEEDQDIDRPGEMRSETQDPTRREPSREGQQERETEMPETPPSKWEINGGKGNPRNQSDHKEDSSSDKKKSDGERNK
jgi:hypothetical protein